MAANDIKTAAVGEENANSSPVTIGSAQGDNVYAESRRRAHKRMPGGQTILVLAITLVTLYLVALVIPKDILMTILNRSQNGYTFSWFVLDLQDNLNQIAAVFTNSESGVTSYVSTMLRYLVVALTGAGLALCGAVYQGTFRNALVTPSTLGVMSGAQLGMAVYVIVFIGGGFSTTELLQVSSSGQTPLANVDLFGSIFASFGFAITSFAGCLIVVGIVLLTMRLIKSDMNGIVMIITGQVIGGVIGTGIGVMRYYYTVVDPYGEVCSMLRNLQVMSFFRNYGIVDVLIIVIPLVITFLVVRSFAPRMQLLAFDETEIRTMGVDVKRMRIIVIALCTLLTALIVSFCGTVGFVGFVVPHLARRFVGPNFKVLLPASMLLGAIFVLGAYTLLVVTIGSGHETLVGMYISIIGGFIFLITVLKGGAQRGGFR